MTHLPGYAVLALHRAHRDALAALRRAELRVVEARDHHTRAIEQERDLAQALAAHHDAVTAQDA